jgi:hypothetical protein
VTVSRQTLAKRPPPFAPRLYDLIIFDGGWDTQTPPLMLESGYVRNAQNFEIGILKGYSRIEGYERFDGRAAPSDATYAILNATITGVYAVGNTLTGATSMATGVIIAATATYFVLTKVSGVYVDTENLQIAGTTRAVAVGSHATDAAPTTKLHAQYRNLAADSYRTDILAMPGSGPVRGGFIYNDVKYGFRDNAGATACVLYKSTTSGWQPVSLGFEVGFSTGTTVIAEGLTITGATSGASAVLKRQVLESGDFLAGTGVGRLIFASITGTFSIGENLQVGGVTKAVCTASQSAITLLPSGRYETENANFGGAINTKRVYGCDGVNRGFEFDGTTFVPIKTGMVPDAPSHLTIHKNHLLFSFGSSVQHSGTSFPYEWTIISGAAELAQGDTVSSFQKLPGSSDGGALLITTRNRLNILYGSSALDWNLVNYGEEQGAYQYTVQRIGGQAMMLDDRGVTSLQTAVTYGNFAYTALSQRVTKWINSQRTKSTASIVCRNKNQYRLFFSDKYALYMTFSGAKVRGSMPVLFADKVECAFSGEMNDGSEVMFFGGSTGYLFQLDKGTSFDGAEIEYYLDFAFDHQKRPRILKRYKHVQLEVAGDGYAELNLSHELGYNSSEIGQPGLTNIPTEFSSSVWDGGGSWDTNLVWDGQTLMPSNLSLDGTAENISLKVRGSSDYFRAFTLSGALIDYSLRRSLR